MRMEPASMSHSSALMMRYVTSSSLSAFISFTGDDARAIPDAVSSVGDEEAAVVAEARAALMS